MKRAYALPAAVHVRTPRTGLDTAATDLYNRTQINTDRSAQGGGATHTLYHPLSSQPTLIRP